MRDLALVEDRPRLGANVDPPAVVAVDHDVVDDDRRARLDGADERQPVLGVELARARVDAVRLGYSPTPAPRPRHAHDLGEHPVRVDELAARRARDPHAHREIVRDARCDLQVRGLHVSDALEEVAELRLLRLHVAPVHVVRGDLDRDALDDLEAVALEADDLHGVVREEPDPREPEVGEDLRADAVVAHVGAEAEHLVRLDRVEALVLERVGLELVLEADPAALLAHVEDDALPRVLDRAHGRVELRAAVAAERAEDVARAGTPSGRARGRARPGRPSRRGADAAQAEREVRALVVVGEVDVEVELAVLGRAA